MRICVGLQKAYHVVSALLSLVPLVGHADKRGGRYLKLMMRGEGRGATSADARRVVLCAHVVGKTLWKATVRCGN